MRRSAFTEQRAMINAGFTRATPAGLRTLAAAGALLLDGPRRFDPGADRGAGFALGRVGPQFGRGQPRHLHMQVDAVQQRPGYLGLVLADLLGGTAATAPPVAEITAGTGIHAGNQHHAR